MPRSYKVLPRKDCCKNKAKSVSAKSVVDNVIYVAMYHVNDSKTMCTLYFFHLQFRILSIRDAETRITHVFHERFMETEK